MTQAFQEQLPRIARLLRRGVVTIDGGDAVKFLNDLVSADVASAGPGRAVYAGLLSPQGKVLFDFIVFRDGGAFLIDIARDRVAEFVKRLGFYRLRANVVITDRSSNLGVIAGWGGAATAARAAAPDPRLATLGWRGIASADLTENATEADYDAHRIALGVPEGGVDFAYGDVFPHEVDMDQLTGVDFTKGCYVGQEVVSRMEHRHTARRRVVMVSTSTESSLPAAGTGIVAAGKPVGTLASSAGSIGLAVVRLDRARAAMDRSEALVAADITVTLALPPWARFSWPAAEPAGGSAGQG